MHNNSLFKNHLLLTYTCSPKTKIFEPLMSWVTDCTETRFVSTVVFDQLSVKRWKQSRKLKIVKFKFLLLVKKFEPQTISFIE